ncbi:MULTISPECIES: NAD(P)/FAD-dependent oxidoreductase [unclassified Mycolicibacterium]|uniref:flavin-containing monooxygenase n=1 Tax=unclassified Mycolicibacterium TaxID=2636767 RepID=UPI001305978E|nr:MULTISPECIES: NAD(P)/FAD-dependent oxidoreductase [unclassified Mycolicibacterium]MUL82572.1 SidA/IucD/PvdA family monooxygenase [Mycolicibacterium sp. CBMA 329]MUL88907.1 SidA/IucD/PvdA family monooxygenase [Mycolicibacterium sp. CBMA 331]MUL97476.1 SidA/IucD/PvdA family monooxygenase [Mycolicibacterium sp. CBMA 334]MUM26800.1 SidA/IucD/PvdA family monooxygenase [Mycolicibacterium sp. CBMA 295]MUM38423.1 SidA/IucD/PvdA family monooxygenase [Mycolicibacterium sp. CBMA 247]
MTRSFHVGQPFTTPNDDIAAALEQVSIPTLLLSLVHITGDPRYIREFKQAGLFLNEVQGFMSEEDKARVREVALPVIADYRDRGCPAPDPLPAELIKEMLDWTACEPVGEDDRPLVLEELDLEGIDPRRPATLENADGFSVIVIGCGESGVLAGVRLKQAGIDFTIVEKNAGPGGTWWENSYPGARVDVANHFYCYSFEPSNHWDHFFAEQHELRQYFRDVVDRHDLESNIRWNTEVVSAAWDDGMWNVTVRSAAGTETLRANAVITAVGQLNRPQIPDFPGAETFEGPAFHSAAWDHTVDVTGKRVALIGAGASGFQIAPAIADKVEHLTVFQRTAQWMFPNPMYHEAVADGVRWAMEHLPYYGRWYRFLLLWPGADKGLDAARVDPDYADQDNAVSEINAMARIMFTDWITTQVGDDPELLAKALPDYPATGKRTLQDNGSWLGTLKRDDVDLIRTPIERITPTGIVTADGETYDADIIVYATGFRATEVLFPMTITGRDGVDLHDIWGQRPYAYRGITVPGFPNFFMTYGPGTHLAHGGSLILNSELQMRYINQCLEHLITEGLRTMEPLPDPTEAWHRRSQEAIRQTVWAHPSVKHSYFKNADGEIHTVSPWRLSEYRSAISEPIWSDFTVQEA